MAWHPSEGEMGDFWFLQGPEALHMYYLMKGAPSPQGFRDAGIGHATSTDGIHWAEHEPIMPVARGNRGCRRSLPATHPRPAGKLASPLSTLPDVRWSCWELRRYSV